MVEKKKSTLISFGNVAKNRKATFNYLITDRIEAGIVLKGPEVKSLRHGRSTINEAYAAEREREIWLFNSYIPEYQGSFFSKFEPRAPRKLLLHKKQIDKLLGAITREGMTLVPLDIFFNARGIAKVTLGLGQGKKKTDKRQAIAERDWKRDKARLMRNKN
ncbi:SsrA-binding protein [Commensalibacter sp. Nvir]|uniref:SsrA-binding protein SmpB n=1 Tax=Commensalibacter sp. Nvir TaxID=3069817 RepID=UPI002D5155DD|nr:SsrA-binding protein [Commensalibacter sp. Nvir]